MRTSWDYSLELEAKRLLHNAHQIATGFYKINGFIVLPYPAPSNDNIVSFPHLAYLSIPRFWERASRIDVSTLPLTIPQDLVDSTQKLLASAHLPKPDYSRLQSQWAKHEHQIISTIYDLIPTRKNSITHINIWPTAFGTGCSFNQSKNPPQPVYIWLRSDQSLSSIVEAILTSITRPDVYTQLGGLWQESEIIVDWLIAYTPLNSLLQKIDPHYAKTLTIKSTRSKQNATLIQKSEIFLRSIGAPQVTIDNIKSLPSNGFSPREKDILNLLISKSPNPVTMDEIGDCLFKASPDNFSLAAIAKTIQRLRDKLESSGISGSYIQTKRGEGYLLVN